MPETPDGGRRTSARARSQRSRPLGPREPPAAICLPLIRWCASVGPVAHNLGSEPASTPQQLRAAVASDHLDPQGERAMRLELLWHLKAKSIAELTKRVRICPKSQRFLHNPRTSRLHVRCSAALLRGSAHRRSARRELRRRRRREDDRREVPSAHAGPARESDGPVRRRRGASLVSAPARSSSRGGSEALPARHERRRGRH